MRAASGGGLEPRSAVQFLNCPRCGLSIKPRGSWLAVEHCPRCIGRARVPVQLFSSSLPAAELYAEDSAPGGEQAHRPDTTPVRHSPVKAPDAASTLRWSSHDE